MNYELAKRNRLNGKFNFKLRDWQFELDGTDDHPPVPFRNGRPKKAKVVWEREQKERPDLYDEQNAG